MSMYLGAANDPQVITVIIWALTGETVSLEISDRVSLKPVCSATGGVCKQHKRRPACAKAQSDQCLCYSCLVKYHIETCYKQNVNFLASLCS